MVAYVTHLRDWYDPACLDMLFLFLVLEAMIYQDGIPRL
jgi:hypothetical protein